jgi:hypothetical protein
VGGTARVNAFADHAVLTAYGDARWLDPGARPYRGAGDWLPSEGRRDAAGRVAERKDLISLRKTAPAASYSLTWGAAGPILPALSSLAIARDASNVGITFLD